MNMANQTGTTAMGAINQHNAINTQFKSENIKEPGTIFSISENNNPQEQVSSNKVFCPNCGKESSTEANFCTSCGQKLK